MLFHDRRTSVVKIPLHWVRPVLENTTREHYHSPDMNFLFVDASVNKRTGYENKVPLTKMNTLYSYNVHWLWNNRKDVVWSEDFKIGDINLRHELLYCQEVQTALCVVIFSLEFHLLDRLGENLWRFRNMSLIDVSAFEHFSVVSNDIIVTNLVG